MSDDYTPTTSEMRQVHAGARFSWESSQDRADTFDRWLTAHDAATRTAAFEEAAVIADAEEERESHKGSDRGELSARDIAASIRAAKAADS